MRDAALREMRLDYLVEPQKVQRYDE